MTFVFHMPQRPANVLSDELPRISLPRLRKWLKHFRVPSAGVPPHGLHVSSRGWKRNSALLMSLYDRPDR